MQAFLAALIARLIPVEHHADGANACIERGKRPRTASSTQMSSSSSSQRRAKPCNRSLAFSSWPCGASASNGYFVAGKLTSRWSASSSQMRRPSTQQRRARAGDGASLSMNANIGFCKCLTMLFDEPLDVPQFGGTEAKVAGERDRLEPILGLEVVTRDMDMWRLVSFPAVEVKSIRPHTHHRRHGDIVPFVRRVSNTQPAPMAAPTDN